MIEAAIIGVSLIMTLGVYILGQRGFSPRRKKLKAADTFTTVVGQAVEKGGRLHLYTGANALGTEQSITALAGISLLEPALTNVPLLDQPPITSSADAVTTMAIMDKLEAIYRHKGVFDERQRLPARQIALDPIAGVAGVNSINHFDQIEASILYGSMGSDIALAAEPGRRKGITQIIASDQIEGQAASFTLCDYPLIGEEVYQVPASVKKSPFADASLIAADIIRWLLVLAIIAGVLLSSIGAIGGS